MAVIERLGELTYGVYAGKGNPALRASDRRRLPGDSAFVVFFDDKGDNFPSELERVIALRVAALHDAIHAIAATERRLTRVATSIEARAPFFLVTRKSIGQYPRTELVVEAIRIASACAELS